MEKIHLRHKFFKTIQFKRHAELLGAWDLVDDLKIKLDRNPRLGNVIQHGQGLRKIRMRLPNSGTRGGARVIYYHVENESIFLIEMYSKRDQEDLSPEDLKICIQLKDEMNNLHGE